MDESEIRAMNERIALRQKAEDEFCAKHCRVCPRCGEAAFYKIIWTDSSTVRNVAYSKDGEAFFECDRHEHPHTFRETELAPILEPENLTQGNIQAFIDEGELVVAGAHWRRTLSDLKRLLEQWETFDPGGRSLKLYQARRHLALIRGEQ